jgi:hypothetical protein
VSLRTKTAVHRTRSIQPKNIHVENLANQVNRHVRYAKF